MMYSDKVAVCLKVNGKVLREDQDTVYLPFGQEYSIYIRNLNSVRALVSVEIDGTDVGEGTSFILPANGNLELERFVSAGNMESGLRFKFIERTQKIEDGPRGIRAEDGLIRISFEFEKILGPISPWPQWTPDWTKADTPPAWRSMWSTTSTRYGVADSVSGTSADFLNSAISASSDVNSATSVRPVSAQAASLNDVGITVGGSVSDQRFIQGSWFPTDGVKHVMVLRTRGQVGNRQVKAPVTVKTKLECPTCGTRNVASSKFCSECGTGLSIV